MSPGDAFPTTSGSAMAALRGADAGARERALGELIAAYWPPVYKYIRLRWSKSPEDAQDLTQEFFARLLEKDFLADFDPTRARLRTFLRVAADRLIQNADRDARREKRGGGMAVLSLDFVSAEGEVGRLHAPGPENAEQFFEREWARSFFAATVEMLRAECERRGKQTHFELFARYDLDDGPAGEPSRPSYAALAALHGIAATDVTNHLAWARREFRRLALERLRSLSSSDDEFRREARALLGIDPP